MAAPAAAAARAGVAKRKSEPLPQFRLVLAAMFAELMVAPFLAGVPSALLVMRAITVVVTLAALWMAGARRAAVLLYLPVLASQLTASYAKGLVLEATAAAVHFAFLFYVLVFIVKRVASASRVSLDTIAGAACAYLLIAMIWADLYLLVELLHPGSYVIPADWITGASRDLRIALTYYSCVTITTVGRLFDVSSPAVGFLSIAETFAGQLYLAVLISRMVGMHTTQATEPATDANGPIGGAADRAHGSEFSERST